MFKRIAGLILISAVLAGCNTIAGAGKDIERGGEKMQGQARETQQEMKRQ